MGKDQLGIKTTEKHAVKSLINSWRTLSDSESESSHEEILNLLNTTAISVQNFDCPRLRLNLTRAMQDCLRRTSSPHNMQLITSLIELSITDTWYQTPLTMILNGNLDHYCANTTCDVLLTQLGQLLGAECKDFALKMCTSCLNIPRLKKDVWVNEMYCTLLFQLGLIEKLTREMLASYTCETAIEFVVRLRTYIDTDAFAFAACVVQIFLVRDLLTQITCTYTSSLMLLWASIQQKLDLDLLRDKVTMLSAIFTSGVHYYFLGHALFTTFRSELLEVCIELYVKGLTVGLNSLETAEIDVKETEFQLAEAFACLAWIVGGRPLLARECYLSAFSVDPTEDRMKRVREFKGFAGSCHCIVRGSCGRFVEMDREVDAQLDGLPEELLEDLSIVLNKPRSKMLSWELEWSELERYCEAHLEAKLAVKEEVSKSPVKMCKNGERKKMKVKRRLKSGKS